MTSLGTGASVAMPMQVPLYEALPPLSNQRDYLSHQRTRTETALPSTHHKLALVAAGVHVAIVVHSDGPRNR